MWFEYRLECIATFLDRVFMVEDQYTRDLDRAYTGDFNNDAAIDHAWDMLLGYQDIALRAVVLELNGLVELELKLLARSVPYEKRCPKRSDDEIDRKFARQIIEKEYDIRLNDVPGSQAVEEVRKIANAYKHDDGFSDQWQPHREIRGSISEDMADLLGKLSGDEVPREYVVPAYDEQVRHKLTEPKALEWLPAVRQFLLALPGERQVLPELRIRSGRPDGQPDGP